MSDSHGENASKAEDTSHGGADSGRSSSKRLLVLTVIMLGFAALTWGPSLLSRNFETIFIPAWLTLTIATVVISVWFTKRLLTAEKYRDSEAAPQGAPTHPH